MNIVTISRHSPILTIIIQILLIYYLYSLRDCTCAMDYKRIYILLYLFTSLFMFRLEKTNRLFIIYYFAGIINIYFVIKYLTSLTCDCSNSPLKNILYLYIIKDGLLITLEGLSIIRLIILRLR